MSAGSWHTKKNKMFDLYGSSETNPNSGKKNTHTVRKERMNNINDSFS